MLRPSGGVQKAARARGWHLAPGKPLQRMQAVQEDGRSRSVIPCGGAISLSRAHAQAEPRAGHEASWWWTHGGQRQLKYVAHAAVLCRDTPHQPRVVERVLIDREAHVVRQGPTLPGWHCTRMLDRDSRNKLLGGDALAPVQTLHCLHA